MQVLDKKLSLLGWLQANDKQTYSSPLKQQKFLFFYEAFARAAGETADFDDLYGYANGPVYKTLYEWHRNEPIEFDREASFKFKEFPAWIDDARAELSNFVVKILSEDELSELSHKFSIWQKKQDLIIHGERNVKLCPEDFAEHDINLAEELRSLYPPDLIANSTVINRLGVSFVFPTEDALKLTEEHYDVLCDVAEKGPGPAGNPLFVEVEPDGCLLID